MTVRQAVAIGLILGVTCALVVWYLERFESNRLHADISDYLSKRDQFRDWLSNHEAPPGESSA